MKWRITLEGFPDKDKEELPSFRRTVVSYTTALAAIELLKKSIANYLRGDTEEETNDN
jgi:hypothetical protein